MHTQNVVWCVNAGKGGSSYKADDVQQLFLEKSYIAIGWAELGNLMPLVVDRNSLKTRMQQIWGWGKETVEQNAATVTRFVSEMQDNDIVLYHRSGTVHIGRVAGRYIYNPRLDSYYPHVRPVVWLTEISKQNLPQEAQATFQTSLSLFRVAKGREVFEAAARQAEQQE